MTSKTHSQQTGKTNTRHADIGKNELHYNRSREPTII
uniref:Uncharacterized protein n=1 Tax=Rhizophora mucronata TaxID=61149 RepID=A0A2P2PA00_RHIMU